mgnify:FL=1
MCELKFCCNLPTAKQCREAQLLIFLVMNTVFTLPLSYTYCCVSDIIRLPADRLPSATEQSSSSDPNETKKVLLTSNDQLYGELRDKNFNAVGPILSQRAKTVAAKYDVSVLG